MKKYAITDIHGCIKSFEALLDKIELSASDELYLLGDYIDRGPGSKEVFDLILKMQEDGYAVQAIAGNHDFAMLDAKTDPSFFRDWRDGWGGQQTLESFQTNNLDTIDWKYWDFISELDLVMEVDEYILVHAGLDFSAKNPLKPDAEMLLIRNWHENIDQDWLDGRIIVHGHTPVAPAQVELMLGKMGKAGVIDIDTGCFATLKPDRGMLTALDLTNRQLHFQKCVDDVSGYWKGRG